MPWRNHPKRRPWDDTAVSDRGGAVPILQVCGADAACGLVRRCYARDLLYANIQQVGRERQLRDRCHGYQPTLLGPHAHRVERADTGKENGAAKFLLVGNYLNFEYNDRFKKKYPIKYFIYINMLY